MFCFYNLSANETTFDLKTKIMINKKLICKIEVNGELIKDVKWLNMPNNKLSCWNQLQNIMSTYGSVFWQHEVNNKMIVHRSINILESIKCEDEDTLHKLALLKCQLMLLFANQKKYCIDTMLFAFMVHRQSSSAYELVRKNFSYPTVRRLGQLSGKLNSMSNINYFREAAKNLKQEELVLTVMVDEIYPDSNVTYKAERLKGFAENPKGVNEVAKTVQAFMVNSMFGSFKVSYKYIFYLLIL